MNKTNDAKNRTLTLERTFDAPIKLVWEAWTQPEHIAGWWGPKGMTTKVILHDFKVGGQWKYSMLMPDGNEFIADGIYSEIVELKKIISSANFKPMTEGVEIQALFEENGDKTNFIFNVVHPTEEYCRQQEKMGFMNGWGSVFDRLAEYTNLLVK
ncbi:SRPBCC domain-containing protein [Aquimarina sp. 2201CG5-10]|uniref:SRPBCC domain-containing protein n=1 Tax=Aquimarina callyspongiae TaxID=3098150 RepID=UPI002AB3E13F|nr:SRPBCC domain-containing protein [Aquimarina sp. 2201CG5-10]MDY8138541.1 SRPBCC domain-containing protein [Aquimarina sp. 2201CG5-10]